MKKIKKVVCLALSLLLCVASVPMQMTSFAVEENFDDFAGGNGTKENPYKVAKPYHLRRLAELVNSSEETENYRGCYYIQTADIDMAGYEWTPIGYFKDDNGEWTGCYFDGHYDGNYKTIYNLNCDKKSNYAGLFGRCGENGADHTETCSITNLSVVGNVHSYASVAGGIVGELCCGANIKNCSFTGNVSVDGSNVGGIVGQIYNGGHVYSCYHNGSVSSGNVNTGGIAGVIVVGQDDYTTDAEISNSYHTGEVIAGNGVQGGIAGTAYTGEKNVNNTIKFDSCYYLDSSCAGAVNGKDYNGCQSMDSDFMKNIDELLGKPFVHNDSAELNDGYPVFEWQSIPYQFKGSGTAEDPYQISSKEELEKMRDLVNSPFFGWKYNKEHYIQTADIDLKNELWTPIGKRMANGVDLSVPMFEGNYNGNYHTIKNLFVNETNGNRYSGLFGSLHGEYNIENLIVYGEVKSNGDDVGGIVGEVVNNGGTVKNCAFIGNVCGYGAVGGIAGVIFQNGSVDSCYHIGSVSGTEQNSAGIGGIVGWVFAGDHYEGVSTVKNCYNIGKVTGSDGQTGSIAGTMELRDNVHGEVYVSNCYSVKGEAPTNANGNYNSYDVKELSDNMMKNDVVRKLGSPFIKNSNTDFNSGYPVFWWQLSGDTNSDGKLSVTDVVAVQKWLHKQGSLSEWQNVDFNGDGKVNVVDLCLMKKLLLSR